MDSFSRYWRDLNSNVFRNLRNQSTGTMKFATIITFACVLFAFRSDTPQSRYARAVADVELSFARTSRETNTVNAFQNFLADDAVLFRQGEAVNGKKLWADREPDSTLLNWWPIVADAAIEGDLGYTTGPYELFNSRTDKMPAGTGFYSTIWQKQEDGKWKIKVDLGVRLAKVQPLSTQLVLVEASDNRGPRAESCQTTDARYNAELNKQSISFIPSFLAKAFRLHRPRIGAIVNKTGPVHEAEQGTDFKFQFVGGGESRSGDLAYTYGNVTRTEKSTTRKANYLRVWKIEKGQWRVVLDVVTEG